MNVKLNPFVLSCFTLFALSASASTELARVNSQSLSLNEFNLKYEKAKNLFGSALPAKAELLEEWVDKEVVLQAAKKEGVDKDPIVQDRVDAVIVEALFERRLAAELKKDPPSEADLKKYYQANPEIRTSHVFAPIPPGATAEVEKAAKKTMDEALSALKSGKSFAEVVQKYSSGPGSGVGGDMDYQTKDRLDPNYYQAALRLGSPGKVSGIVKTQYGLHIIRLSAIRAWDDVEKSQIQRLYLIDKQNSLRKSLISTLRKSASIRVNKKLLSN